MCLFNCAISFVLLGLSSIVLKKLTVQTGSDMVTTVNYHSSGSL